MSGPGKRFYGVVMGTRGLQKCGIVSKAVSVVNGWYRFVLFSECWEAEPGVTSGAITEKEGFVLHDYHNTKSMFERGWKISIDSEDMIQQNKERDGRGNRR